MFIFLLIACVFAETAYVITRNSNSELEYMEMEVNKYHTLTVDDYLKFWRMRMIMSCGELYGSLNYESEGTEN